MEKINKNHFSNPVVIILFLILIGIGGYFFFSKNSSTTQDNSPNPQQAEIDALKKTVEDLKNQKPQTITKEVPAKSGPDLSLIITKWRPRIAHIECKSWDVNGNIISDALGSGLLAGNLNKNNIYFIFTNRHVITDQQGNIPSICYVKFPESDQISTIITQKTNSNDPNSWTIDIDQDFDVGDLFIKNPTFYIKSTAAPINYCKKRASVGDQLVVLGYPGIGSQTDITATEGIISGYDGGYYITSAKVEHGNSGGVAILLKDNCYLGIPSYANTGEIESLARILDFNFYQTTTFGGN